MKLHVHLLTMVYAFGLCDFASTSISHQKRDADFESVRTRLDRPFVSQEGDTPGKYFHESSFHQHYDGRFADRPLKYDEKQAHLTALIQTYLSTMTDIGAETWLMHGTLLGWYWNRKVMPWDSDLDMMISDHSLRFLASYYNMTMHRFKFSGQRSARNYLLEINPHYAERDLDEDNHIDARWIDTENGLFIDITTLRQSEPPPYSGEVERMMVKDNHHYFYDDIYPLRSSVFENASVKIPYAYADILIEEYGDEALSRAHHQSHRFDVASRAWVPDRISLTADIFGDG